MKQNGAISRILVKKLHCILTSRLLSQLTVCVKTGWVFTCFEIALVLGLFPQLEALLEGFSQGSYNGVKLLVSVDNDN